jgi:hypothetical protein
VDFPRRLRVVADLASKVVLKTLQLMCMFRRRLSNLVNASACVLALCSTTC